MKFTFDQKRLLVILFLVTAILLFLNSQLQWNFLGRYGGIAEGISMLGVFAFCTILGPSFIEEMRAERSRKDNANEVGESNAKRSANWTERIVLITIIVVPFVTGPIEIIFKGGNAEGHDWVTAASIAALGIVIYIPVRRFRKAHVGD